MVPIVNQNTVGLQSGNLRNRCRAFAAEACGIRHVGGSSGSPGSIAYSGLVRQKCAGRVVPPTPGLPPLHDPHAEFRDELIDRVLGGAGESEPAVRRAVADNAAVPPVLRFLVDKIHRHAYKVTDEDVARLQAKYGDDALFEVIVSAALGASRQRLDAGLAALEEA